MRWLTIEKIVLTIGLAFLASLFFSFYTHAAAGPPVTPIISGGTATSTHPSFGQVLVGGKNGEYEFAATSTFGAKPASTTLLNDSNTFSGTTTLATTTTSVLNGVIVVDGVRYAATAAGINAAICAAIPTSGSSGEVDLPPGLDVLSASINYRCNQYRTGVHLKIKGAGIDTTTLKLGNNVATDPAIRAVIQGYPQQMTQPLTLYANASSTIEISDLTVDYNGQHQTVNSVVGGIFGDNSFSSTYVHNVKVQNVVVPTFNRGAPSLGIGFDPYDARNVRSENNQFFNNDEGLWVTAYDNGIDINSFFDHNNISSTTDAAIYDEAGSGVEISFNYIANSLYGIDGNALKATDQQSIVYNEFATGTVTTLYNISSIANVAVISRPVGGKGFTIPSRNSLFFNSGDLNWRIGKIDGVSNNFNEAINGTGIELTTGSAAHDGFSIGVELGSSIAEFNGSTLTSFFRSLVGIGTSSPFAKLSVQANNGDTATTLFAIGSSTASATSTLFSISNTGSTTLFQLNSSLLKTNANGTIVAAVAGTDYAPAGNYATFAYPFLNSATSSMLTFSSGLVSNGSTTITGLASGLVGNNNGLLYGFASSSLFGYLPLNPTRNILTTYPLQGGGNLSGDLTLSSAFGTTTTNFFGAYNNFSSLFATNASTTNATTTNLHITSLTNGGLAVDANGRVYSSATSTLNTIGGTLALTQIATQAAGTFLANGTSGSAAPIAIATSSIFGTGIGGQMLVWANGVPSWMATSTFSAPFVFANNNVTCTSAAAGVTGCLTGTDWNTFNGKDSFAYPFTPGNGFNSTTTGLMILASSTIGNGTQVGGLTISGGATTTGISFHAAQGTVSNPSVAVFAPGVGLYNNGAAALGLAAGGSGATWDGSAFYPNSNNTKNLGIANTNQWQTLFVGTASTSNLTVSLIQGCSGSSALTTNSSGAVACGAITASGGAFPFTPQTLGNATGTLLLLNGGMIAAASSTIGNGTQASGLTISGGATTTGNAVVNGTLAVGKSLVNSPSSISTNGDIDVALASYTRYNSDGNWRIGGVTASAPTTRSMVSGNSLYETGDSIVFGLNTGNSSLELNNSTGAAYIRGKVGIGTTTPATKLQVSSGASATTTVTVGELGLTSSKACVNMNAADGSASSFYINAAHALVVEANYCR